MRKDSPTGIFSLREDLTIADSRLQCPEDRSTLESEPSTGHRDAARHQLDPKCPESLLDELVAPLDLCCITKSDKLSLSGVKFYAGICFVST